MKVERRQFLKLGLVHGLAISAQRVAAIETPPPVSVQRRQGPSILQGATDETQTQFSIVYNRGSRLKTQARGSDGSVISSAKDETYVMGKHPDRVSKFYFDNLKPGVNYFLDVLDDESGKRIDRRLFKTLQPKKKNLSFVLCSCMNDENHEPEIWTNMAQKKPDILFFIGDSVYADTGASDEGADPAYLWQRFCEARRTLEIYYSPTLIPILATWDDHDFGLNDSDSTSYKHVSQSQKNFKIFFAQDPRFCKYLTEGPGVSTAFRWQQHLFLLMDDRSFRLPKDSGDRYGHWGREQENWMLTQIEAGAKTSWVMNGSQVFPAMPFKESMSQNHPEQLEGALAQLKKLPSKVVFVSGDVHYSEISEIEESILGYKTYELTSSSIHSKNFPGVPHVIPNKRRVSGTGVGARNYLMVNVESSFRSRIIQCDAFTVNGSLAFSKILQV